MARTVSRAKNRPQEALRQLLRGVHWSHFVMNDSVKPKPKVVSRGGIDFTARYGLFLKITGVAVFADDQMIRFIPCVCPLRDTSAPGTGCTEPWSPHLLQGGGYPLLRADLLYKKRGVQYRQYMLRREGTTEPILRAWCSVMGPV